MTMPQKLGAFFIMTDPEQELEQLKQQLYAKIQVTQKPEQPPSEGDLLKYSQLSTYQAHQRLRYQTGQRLMDEKREQIAQSLKTALNALENAHTLMNSSGLDKSHYELSFAICDAMTAIQEGCDRLADGVDE